MKGKRDRTITSRMCKDHGCVNAVGTCGVEGFGDAQGDVIVLLLAGCAKTMNEGG